MACLQCEIHSDMVRMHTSLVAILPLDNPKRDECRATLYLLHGKGQNSHAWMRYSRIESYAEKYNIAVIMPEAERSFYTDMRYGSAYYSYVTRELPDICRRLFNIPEDPAKTYIAGLSMGGYGTLRCLFNRPELYAGGAAFSSVTDIHWRLREIKESAANYPDFQAIFGIPPQPNAEEDIFLAAGTFMKANPLPKLYISCGTEDTRHEQNLRLSKFLREKGCDHKFEDWKGEHDWDFWDISIQKALSYFFD